MSHIFHFFRFLKCADSKIIIYKVGQKMAHFRRRPLFSKISKFPNKKIAFPGKSEGPKSRNQKYDYSLHFVYIRVNRKKNYFGNGKTFILWTVYRITPHIRPGRYVQCNRRFFLHQNFRKIFPRRFIFSREKLWGVGRKCLDPNPTNPNPNPNPKYYPKK